MIGAVADFKVWATARGHASVAASDDTTLAIALQRGSDYIEFSYVVHFAVGHDASSDGVEEAAYTASLYELNPDGSILASSFWDKTYTPAEQKVLTQAGPIKWTVVGAEGASASPTSTRIDAMLSRYMAERSTDGVPDLFIGAV